MDHYSLTPDARVILHLLGFLMWFKFHVGLSINAAEVVINAIHFTIQISIVFRVIGLQNKVHAYACIIEHNCILACIYTIK